MCQKTLSSDSVLLWLLALRFDSLFFTLGLWIAQRLLLTLRRLDRKLSIIPFSSFSILTFYATGSSIQWLSNSISHKPDPVILHKNVLLLIKCLWPDSPTDVYRLCQNPRPSLFSGSSSLSVAMLIAHPVGADTGICGWKFNKYHALVKPEVSAHRLRLWLVLGSFLCFSIYVY